MADLSIHHTIATYRMRSQVAKEDLKVARARAETDIISQLNGTYGKNAEERERQLLIGLADHKAYQFVLTTARAYENDLLQAEADLAIYLDTRRQDEWAVRAALVNALERKAIFPDDRESTAEAVMDSALDTTSVEMYLHAAGGTTAAEGLADGERYRSVRSSAPNAPWNYNPQHAPSDDEDYGF